MDLRLKEALVKLGTKTKNKSKSKPLYIEKSVLKYFKERVED